MEQSSVLDKARKFLEDVKKNDPAPVPLEETSEGQQIVMELGLGLYDVKDESALNHKETPGTLVPELLDKDEPQPSPGIQDLTPQ